MKIEEKKNRKFVANVGSYELVPIIDPNSEFKYRYPSKSMALKKLEDISLKYIVSKDNDEESEENLLLWIKGYQITEEEISRGYLGNYCLINIRKSGKIYTFIGEKILKPLKHHPQRKRKPAPHPDWGHPIMRYIKKQPLFDSEIEAKIQLIKLQEQFPKAAIPGGKRLYLQVFSNQYKSEPNSKPVKKFIFEVIPKENDKYAIDYWENPVQGKLERYKFHEYNFSTFR